MSPSGLILPPGTYLIEFITNRPGIDADVVRRGLEMAGFEAVIADEPETVAVPPHVGAAMSVRPGGVSRGASPSVPRAAAATRLSPTLRASLSPVLSKAPKKMGTAPKTSLARVPPKVSRMARTTLTKDVKTATQVVKSAPQKRGLLGMLGGGDDGGGVPNQGGGDDGGSAGPNFVEDPNDPRYATDTNTGLRYYMDPTDGTMYGVDGSDGSLIPIDQTSLAPTGAAHLPPPDAAAGSGEDGSIDTSAQGEGPFGEDPSYSLSVGAAMAGAVTFRMVARNPGQVALNAGEGISWAARPLEVDPYAGIPARVKPFLLSTGQTYDMVVLSRDRKCNGRGDVFTLAEAMGFEPHDIALLQGDIHLPGRPSASYSRWLLVATWEGPTSITTAEEPLVFDQVSPGKAC